MLNCFLDSCTVTRLLSIDPTDTASATSAYVDVSGYEGQIASSRLIRSRGCDRSTGLGPRPRQEAPRRTSCWQSRNIDSRD
jgi:hypothetical protein